MVMDPSGRLRRIEEGEAIYYDTANGIAGQGYPIGTIQMPAQNWADLAAIVTQRGISTVKLLSDIAIGGAIANWNIIGDVGRTVTLGGQVLTACYFELCVLAGNLGAGSSIYALNCLIAASTVQECRLFNCEVDGVQIFTANPSYFYQCYGRGVTLDMTNDPTVYVYGGKGNWTVVNLTAGGVANIFLDAGTVTLAASCTGGTVNIYGTCQVVDGSGGSAVNDYSIKTDTLALLANLGYEGATALADKLTAVRAGYLDELDFDLQAALNAIAGFIDGEITVIDGIVDNILLDTQVRKVQSGVKVINAGITKYLSIDSGTNGAEILSIAIEGLVGHDWTLDVYVPAADAEAASQAKSKRDTIAYAGADTEGGLLKPFAIPFNCYLDFTNDGANDQIDEVTITYRSRGTLTLAWEA